MSTESNPQTFTAEIQQKAKTAADPFAAFVTPVSYQAAAAAATAATLAAAAATATAVTAAATAVTAATAAVTAAAAAAATALMFTRHIFAA